MGQAQKGQVEVTFNWVYILIAGAIILLFFVAIVVKQKAQAEENLATDVVRLMESIFTAAGAAEKTKNVVDAGGLTGYTLYFNCEDGVSIYGIKEQSARVEDAINPFFAPLEIKTAQLITWSLPYKLPFKIIDLLFVTSSNTRYYIYGTEEEFINEFLNATQGMNVKAITQGMYASLDPEKNFQIRIIDVDGTLVKSGSTVPEKIQQLDDDRVTALVFSGSQMVTFFAKEGKVWKKLNNVPISIISLGGERDAAKYAAIFAGNDQLYQCNMKKVFRRLKYVNEVYGGEGIAYGEVGGKLKEIVDYYEAHPELTLSKQCLGFVKTYIPETLIDNLQLQHNRAAACLSQQSSCIDLIKSADALRKINEQLEIDCLTLY